MKILKSYKLTLLGEDEGEAGFHLAHQVIERALSILGATVHWYDKPVCTSAATFPCFSFLGCSTALKSPFEGEHLTLTSFPLDFNIVVVGLLVPHGVGSCSD